MNKNFIIYLDIDGVLVSYLELKNWHEDGEHMFKKEAVDTLNAIISYYNADLRMITSWNSKFKDAQHYKDFLVSRGINVNSLTIGNDWDRAKAIEEEIRNKEVDKYLIIDDESHQYLQSYFKNNIIEYKRILTTNPFRCLDSNDLLMVTRNWKLNV